MKKNSISIILLIVFILSTGFNLDNAIVPKEHILSGGPPKDGIPAILKPNFIRPDQADFLGQEDQVIGVEINGMAKAYPLKILNWHEVVNDTVNGIPIMVTF
jgi:hypothetical protein